MIKRVVLASAFVLLTLPSSAQQPKHHITVDELVRSALAMQTRKHFDNFAAQFKRYTGHDFTDSDLINVRYGPLC